MFEYETDRAGAEGRAKTRQRRGCRHQKIVVVDEGCVQEAAQSDPSNLEQRDIEQEERGGARCENHGKHHAAVMAIAPPIGEQLARTVV